MKRRFFRRRSEFLESELKTLTAVHAEKLKEHETLSQKLLESERYFLHVRVVLIFTIFSLPILFPNVVFFCSAVHNVRAKTETSSEAYRTLQAELEQSKAAFAEQMVLVNLRSEEQVRQFHGERNLLVSFTRQKSVDGIIKSINQPTNQSNQLINQSDI